MSFSHVLNEYMERISCTGKELAESTGISPAVISRYRAGSRAPARDSEQLQKLAEGVAALAVKAGHSDIAPEAVLSALSCELGQTFDFERITQNLNELITTLELNINELARSMNYDASYISRIRAGQRRPLDPDTFATGVCRFVARRRARSTDKAAVAALIGCTADDIAEERAYVTVLREWFVSGTAQKPDHMSSFLSKLDEFDLNDYIRSIRFDELKVPTVPFQFPTSKHYFGMEQMKAGELDFFKATVLSRSKESVFMCSDMEMEDIAEDVDFGKKWMFAIAMTLKKGLHLNMIHNLDRPFEELMLGLESWVPIYMTGQVSPYYLKGARSGVYCHLDYVSGAAALTGECVAGYHKKAKYYLTKNKEEVAYYQEKAGLLLKKARPLMDIYRQNSENAYRAFLLKDADTEGTRHGILSSPPLYTMSEELLRRILDRNAIAETDQMRILEFAAAQRTITETILRGNIILNEISCVSEDEFSSYPVALSLAGAFYEKDVFYTYEEYLDHLHLTKEFADAHENYTAGLNVSRAFRHIQINIHKGKWAMISKNRSPTIHFVIQHPKLREAIENLVIPVVDA